MYFNNVYEIIENFSKPERIIANRNLPERKANFSIIPAICDKQLKKCLNKMGYFKLYCHQAEMFIKAEEGKNIIITTGTASGKSLAFYLPVIQKIIQNPARRAVFIYPTKALTQDQMKNLQPFTDYFGEKILRVGIYDGDTPPSQRKKIREEANIILTNPDMINSAFLPNHNRYGFPHIFKNLSFVVLDELHTYRGAFGSHVSNLIKRLLRICKFHSSRPQFLCSSATIGNPEELAGNICHVDFLHISEDGSPAPEKEIMFWQPPLLDVEKTFQRPVSLEVIELLPHLIENNFRFISFCISRKQTEVVTKESRDTLNGKNGSILANKLAGYRGGYLPEERRRIERSLLNGDILGVVSTNALELGIDIGSLEIVIMAGFPGTRASFWQQLGRAGRRTNKAYAILILRPNSIDQFIGRNPDWLLGTSTENAVIDKNNIYIQLSHIRAAAAELPLTIDDIGYFPDLGEVLPLLEEIGEIEEIHSTYHWKGSSSPAHEFSLRNITNETVEVFDRKNDKTLTTMDLKQAKRELHPGAIYLHETVQYKCFDLDLEKKIATVEPVDLHYYTEAKHPPTIQILSINNEKTYNRVKINFGLVNVSWRIDIYKMIQFYNHQNIGYEILSEPLEDDIDTEACWIEIPENVKRVLDFLKIDSYINYYSGITHAVKHITEMTVMASYSDIDGDVIEYLKPENNQNLKISSIIIFDNYPGGLGFSQKMFETIDQIINNAILLVKNCRCKSGCPVCVGDYRIDKKVILWALENFLIESEIPENITIPEKEKIQKVQKLFIWENIITDWTNIIKVMREHQLYGAEFLSTAMDVMIKNHSLILYFPEKIVKLADKLNIKKAIYNNISELVALPEDFTLQFKSLPQDNSSHKESFLIKRLKNRED